MTKASIRGFFRIALEKQGRWPEAIHELVEEWTMLPAPEAVA